jgi:hypothetical protein
MACVAARTRILRETPEIATIAKSSPGELAERETHDFSDPASTTRIDAAVVAGRLTFTLAAISAVSNLDVISAGNTGETFV